MGNPIELIEDAIGSSIGKNPPTGGSTAISLSAIQLAINDLQAQLNVLAGDTTNASEVIMVSTGATVEAEITAIKQQLSVTSNKPVVDALPTFSSGHVTPTIGTEVVAVASSVTLFAGHAVTNEFTWNKVKPGVPSSAIPNSNSLSYIPTASDNTFFLTITQVAIDNVTGVRSDPKTSVLTTAAVTGVTPSNSVAPTLVPSGTQQTNVALTSAPGTWNVTGSDSYQAYEVIGGVRFARGVRSSSTSTNTNIAQLGNGVQVGLIRTGNSGSSLGLVSIEYFSNIVTVAGAPVIASPTDPSLVGSGSANQKIFITSGASFVAPVDWPGIADLVQTWGAGAAGGDSLPALNQGPGGGGGGYSSKANVTAANGATMQVGTGGATAYANGGDTWFDGASLAASEVGAKGGVGGDFNTSLGGAGGAAASGIGTIKFSGGAGGNATGGSDSGGGGGGGAAGPNGDGKNGGSCTGANFGAGGGGGSGGGTAGAVGGATAGGNGGDNFAGTGHGTGGAQDAPGTDATFGGGGGGAGKWTATENTGGFGGQGQEIDASHGSGGGGGGGSGEQTAGDGGLYGGGGGGDGRNISTQFGSGANGQIVVTYTGSATLAAGTTYTITPATWTSDGAPVTPSARVWQAIRQSDQAVIQTMTTAVYPVPTSPVGHSVKVRELATINGDQYPSDSIAYTVVAPTPLTATVLIFNNVFTQGQAGSSGPVFSVAGGQGPYQIVSVNPFLPEMNVNTFIISGTFLNPGVFPETATIQDALGAQTTAQFQITVNAASSIPVAWSIDASIPFASQPGRLQYDAVDFPLISSISDVTGYTRGGLITNTVNGVVHRFGKVNVGGVQTIRHAIRDTDVADSNGRRMDISTSEVVTFGNLSTGWLAFKCIVSAAVYNSNTAFAIPNLHGATDGGWAMSLYRSGGAGFALRFQILRDSISNYTNFELGAFFTPDVFHDIVIRWHLDISGATSRTQVWIDGVVAVDSFEINCASNTFPAYIKIAHYDGANPALTTATGVWWNYTKAKVIVDIDQAYLEPQIRALVQ